ncbi:MAG: hypothetical protein KatS3mg093_449 [Candidatus Parcubacteria bacterium]|nr:MAG: hypothetical protein KatS3mg093_449 [Candidatus Parcubacteria bacterium]
MLKKNTEDITIIQLIQLLNENKFIEQLINETGLFFDEPKIFYYSTNINPQPFLYHNPQYYNYHKNIFTATGVSWFKKDWALRNCLFETIERICFYLYPISSFKFHCSKEKPGYYLLLPVNDKNKSLKNQKLGWAKGLNFTTNKEYFIPSQLIWAYYPHFLLYNKNLKEDFFAPATTNGMAAGTDFWQVLLHGLYETIERDAAITSFLTKAPIKAVNLNKIKSEKIQKINQVLKKYRLKWLVFNISNDLEIPVFLSIIYDKTQASPKIAAGVRADLDQEKAIIKSCEEAFIARLSSRKVLLNNNNKIINIEKDEITTFEGRINFWLKKENVKKLNYLINKPKKSFKIESQAKKLRSNKEKAIFIKDKLKKKGFDIYYVDITMPEFKKKNIIVLKVIIPGLQDIYINERDKNRIINIERLKQVAKYFNKQKLLINDLPHFFI